MFVRLMKTKRTEKERSVLFKRREKNAKNVPFFLKERKRKQRMEHSFEKKGCPTLQKFKKIYPITTKSPPALRIRPVDHFQWVQDQQALDSVIVA